MTVQVCTKLFMSCTCVFHLGFRIFSVINMYRVARKPPRSDNGDASDGPSKIPRCEDADNTSAAKVSVMDLDDIAVLRRGAVDTDDHSSVGVGVPVYAGVGYQGPATSSVRLDHEVAPERTLLLGGYN